MQRKSHITSLPVKFQTGLHLLERGYSLCNGGDVKADHLPGKIENFLNQLDNAEIDWVLVGAEALNLYLKSPRATVDVDIIVRKKHLQRARKILDHVCTDVKDTEVHYKGVISPPPRSLTVDVIKSQSHRLFEEALDRKILVEGVKAPPIEVLLALKFLSAASPWRPRESKIQDVADFVKAFKENKSRIERHLLVELASLAHANARGEFENFLSAVEEDGPITI